MVAMTGQLWRSDLHGNSVNCPCVLCQQWSSDHWGWDWDGWGFHVMTADDSYSRCAKVANRSDYLAHTILASQGLSTPCAETLAGEDGTHGSHFRVVSPSGNHCRKRCSSSFADMNPVIWMVGNSVISNGQMSYRATHLFTLRSVIIMSCVFTFRPSLRWKQSRSVHTL